MRVSKHLSAGIQPAVLNRVFLQKSAPSVPEKSIEPDILANKAIKKYRHSLERRFSNEGISFEFVLSADNPVWVMDEIQFQRALLNLVINAADAISDKKRGRIRISTEVTVNQCLTVSVVDNGCGIPLSKMDKVLDLFFTTKGTKGTGLGLAMVQKFVETTGGKLTFKSKEGIGSKFQMIFLKDQTDLSE